MNKVKQPKPCNQSCPKCGSVDLHLVFAAAGQIINLGFAGKDTKRKNQFVNIDGWHDAKVIKDCLRCHCRTCQFDWEVAPLDNQNKNL